MYRPTITTAAYFGKNSTEKNEYIGSFAEQLINGVKIVIFLSLSDESVLFDITVELYSQSLSALVLYFALTALFFLTAYPLQKQLWPYIRYPQAMTEKEQSHYYRQKFNTLPTPLNMPFIISECITGFTFTLVSPTSVT